MSIHPFLIFTASLIALVSTTGCGEKEDAKLATQVAARANGDEITMHQINYVLARSQNITPEVAAHAKREILDRLIDQQLAKQKAIENGLDRTPNVMQAVEAVKSEILARAYLEQIAAGSRKPTPVETHDYYVKHPELFAQRRLFDIEELTFVAQVEVATGLREQLSKANSIRNIAIWLEGQGVKFAANRGVRAAEQVPLEILPKMQSMKEGEIQLFETNGGRFQVIRVVTFKPAPVDEATATPRIQQFLSNRNASEAIAKAMRKIKEQAKIEYVGEFASSAAPSKSEAKSKARAESRGETTTKPQAFKYSWEIEAQSKSREPVEERSQK